MNEIQVLCYEGYRDNQRPTKFTLGEKTLHVCQIDDQWYSPSAMYFRVRADDGNLYILRYDQNRQLWTLDGFRRADR